MLPASPQTLTVPRFAAIAANGLFLWAVGVLAIRWIGPTGALGNGATPIVYALLVAVTIPAVAFTPRLVGLGPEFRQVSASIMAGVAALMDGLAIRYTHIYADDWRDLTLSASSLLWAIGVLVVLGLAMSVPQAAGRDA